MQQSRTARWVLGVLSALVLIGIGYGAGLITPSLRAPGNTSPEAGFARDMSAHHAQAVGMANLELQYGSTPAVKELALAIATSQQAQIGMMTVWLQDWKLQPTGTQARMAWMPDGAPLLPGGLMPGMASVTQMNQLNVDRGKAEDILFCQLMLRHHLGGIHMAEGILQLTHLQQVRDLATSMVNDQQGEVGTLQDLLKQLGAQPLSS